MIYSPPRVSEWQDRNETLRGRKETLCKLTIGHDMQVGDVRDRQNLGSQIGQFSVRNKLTSIPVLRDPDWHFEGRHLRR